MGLVSFLLDATIVLFSAVLVVAITLIDFPTIAPSHLYPQDLVELKQLYDNEYGDYLMKEKPHFFVGLV